MKPNQNLPIVIMYCDGAAEPNPGRGGYGIILRRDGSYEEKSGCYERTTNNRMELLAAIIGIESLKMPSQVTIFSDSRYVVDGAMNRITKKFVSYGSKKRPIPNADLWRRMMDSMRAHNVKLIWIKGHSGIEENERCDHLANLAICGSESFIDDGYVYSSTARITENQPKVPQVQN
jgi:ribonuclease HI